MERPIFPITKKEAEKCGVTYSSQENKNALFPSQLRDLRKKKGVSQAVLSAALGVSKSTVGLWETGDTLPDARALHDIAEYFEVSADYLLGFTSDSHRMVRAADDLGISREAVNVLEFFKANQSEMHDADIVSKFISSHGFCQLIKQIDYLSRLVDEVKQLPHAQGGFWDSEFSSAIEKKETKAAEKELSERLGYPVYVITPDKRLAGELEFVRELAGNLAKDISGMESNAKK